MTKKDHHLNERGIAHLGLVLLVVAVLAVGYVAYSRVNTANKSSDTTTASTSKNSQTDKDAAALESADKSVQKTPTDVNSQESNENVLQ